MGSHTYTTITLVQRERGRNEIVDPAEIPLQISSHALWLQQERVVSGQCVPVLSVRSALKSEEI